MKEQRAQRILSPVSEEILAAHASRSRTFDRTAKL
jgi:hypothetical protein